MVETQDGRFFISFGYLEYLDLQFFVWIEGHHGKVHLFTDATAMTAKQTMAGVIFVIAPQSLT
jgi:hypothetical protein